MSDRIPHTYPQGVTSWIDLDTPDVDRAIEFYGALFGWTCTDALPPDAPLRYVIAFLDGQPAAAIASGDRPGWNTYVAVDDADASANAWRQAGGVVLSGPDDVGPPDAIAGRMSVVRDPQGAEVRLWQAGERLGTQVNNVPGAWNFSDLHTSDVEAAQRFYGDMFGWRFGDLGGEHLAMVPGYGDHLEATVDPGIRERQANAPDGFEDAIGGITTSGDDEAPHWHVTFSVENRDATAGTVERLGGTVLETASGGWAKTARILDPMGAEFSVSQFAPPDDY